jgi:hypothetical protein
MAELRFDDPHGLGMLPQQQQGPILVQHVEMHDLAERCRTHIMPRQRLAKSSQ